MKKEKEKEKRNFFILRSISFRELLDLNAEQSGSKSSPSIPHSAIERIQGLFKKKKSKKLHF